MDSVTFDYWRDQNSNQEVATMYYIGLDVASKSSFVYVIDGRGKTAVFRGMVKKGSLMLLLRLVATPDGSMTRSPN